MSVVPDLDKMPFPTHYAYMLVNPGETKDVFSLSVQGSGGYIAFIERMAWDMPDTSNPPATDPDMTLIIDGIPREIDYEIEINKPYIYDPPIVATKSIIFRITNHDVPNVQGGVQKTGGHYYGVLIDGIFAKPKMS